MMLLSAAWHVFGSWIGFCYILEFIVCINIIYIQVTYLSICLWCCGVDVTGRILRLIDSTLYVLYNNTFWWLLCLTLLSAVSLGTPGIIVQIRPYNHKKLTVTVSNQVRSMCDLVVEARTRGWRSGWCSRLAIVRLWVQILVTTHSAGGGELSTHRS